VGNDEESGPLVTGPDIGCANNAPFRIEPDFGKVGEDDVESERKVACDVFKDDESGS
jgi:hypothetical protein